MVSFYFHYFQLCMTQLPFWFQIQQMLASLFLLSLTCVLFNLYSSYTTILYVYIRMTIKYYKNNNNNKTIVI